MKGPSTVERSYVQGYHDGRKAIAAEMGVRDHAYIVPKAPAHLARGDARSFVGKLIGWAMVAVVALLVAGAVAAAARFLLWGVLG